MAAISRATAPSVSVAPKIKAKNTSSQNHATQAAQNEASAATSAEPTKPKRVPLRSSNTPPSTVPAILPKAKPVITWAAPPADTPNSPASTGIVGIIIAQAPEKKVLT